MPNRILRDWTDSERIDELTVHAERFFTRLIMKVDDYGRYNANIKFLKSTLFPLKTDVRETDITRWLAECEKSGLIALYTVASKEYVQIENFKQVLRQKNEKYPGPEKKDCDTSDSHLLSTRTASASLNRIEVETESEDEDEAPQADVNHPPEIQEAFKAFNAWIDTNAPNVRKIKKQISIEGYLKLKKQCPRMSIVTSKLEYLHNTPKYWNGKEKKEDVYLTIKNWIRRDNSQ